MSQDVSGEAQKSEDSAVVEQGERQARVLLRWLALDRDKKLAILQDLGTAAKAFNESLSEVSLRLAATAEGLERRRAVSEPPTPTPSSTPAEELPAARPEVQDKVVDSPPQSPGLSLDLG